MIRCGFSELDVTPWLGLNIPGYLTLRTANGVKDNLYAKAMVISDENSTVGIVSLDALDLELDDVKRIRKRVHLFTGIEENNIMVCSTHTHTGGPVVNCFVTKRDEEYINYLVNKAADALIVAFNKMIPARIGTGKGFVDDISFNRRYIMKDGTAKTNPGVLNPMVVKPAGPIDPDVTIIKAEDMEGNIIGTVVNFSCHLDVVGGNEYSADYAGELGKLLKSVYGQEFVSLFLNGLSGNINHINVNDPDNKSKSPLHYKKMGRILAGETVKVLTNTSCESNLSVCCKKETLSIPLRKLKEEDLIKAQIEVNANDISEIDKVFANEILEFSKNRTDSADVEVQVIKIGNTTITGFPGDVFVEYGLQIKKGSPFEYNLLSSHTNGRNGYIPTKEAFAQGGYEIRTTRSNKLAHNAGEIITKCVLSIMNEIKTYNM